MARCMKHKKTSLVTTDDGKGEDIQQPQIYAKDSLDRFGDDLFGIVLSYLSLEDRFRCECVSKQFQRTVFESVVDINLSDGFVSKVLKEKRCDTQLLATIAIKCANIQTIDCREVTYRYAKHIPEVLNTLRDNCPHLRDIYCNLYLIGRRAQRMCSLAPLVTRIDYITDRQALTHCHRLSELRIDTFMEIFGNDGMHSFVAHNQCLKSFMVSCPINPQVLVQLCGQLSRLPQLRELTLNLRLTVGHNPLNDSLRTIGVNCKQLKRLSLNGYSNPTQTLDSLVLYTQLKRFHLRLAGIVANGLLDPLKHCKRLTHLELELPRIDINLFKNMDKNYLRLHYLWIRTNVITRECLPHVSRFAALQKLVIHFNESDGLSGNDFSDLLTTCPKLKTIEPHFHDMSNFWRDILECVK
ncbi:unnamed protein product [Medioppia subpectinata]|uniref:F-box domain-containing protein n=1 Tax=Medioppia subpectinata TaxID=1979941 RepID=A0A7R9KM83_9ACAR|nr:unnamed protein product [Medioppia subpectinata]CAG2106201.1 unnamed protein product [Medioppia subpectinata]